MIILDTDVILVDYRYPRDPRFPDNRRAIDLLRQQQGIGLGIATQALLELVGVLSFNVSTNLIDQLPNAITTQYGLTLFPSPAAMPDYVGCTFDEIVHQMRERMGLGDAVQAILIQKFAPQGSTPLTWNAKHFLGKLAIPVMTPAEWLALQP
ncbi:MAG: hypothetical protein U0791_03195 [Gemmataceae bacterium]